MSKSESSVDRRQFLRLGGLAGVGALAATAPAYAAEPKSVHRQAIRYGMIIDLKKCVGCKACAAAGKAENHTPPGVAYNILIKEEVGTYPDVRRRFISRPCMHCATPSCTIVCPTKAMHIRDDGIVAIDYHRCIGHRYCISACPYGVRAFDYGGHNYHEKPTPHKSQPSPEYGRNKKRSLKGNKSPRGNVRKCHFCIHRVKKGLRPACASTCIANPIHFGNLSDPDALCTVHGERLRFLLATRNHMRLTGRNCMSGELFDGLPALEGPTLADGQPFKGPDYPFRLITFKEIFGGQSRTMPMNQWLTELCPENAVLLNPVDAKKLGLSNGDRVRLGSATNPDGSFDLGNGEIRHVEGPVRVLQGLRRGVVAVSWHFGHWASGSGDMTVDGSLIKGNPRQSRGLSPNPVMLEDTVARDVCLTDPIGGSASFLDTYIKITPIKERGGSRPGQVRSRSSG